jgi:probable phosphoglycerate mutase
MSDLQCAATVIVVRHGEAEYESEGLSDDGGSLTVAGRDQAARFAATLADRRIATVWCSELARAVQTAEIVAGVLGCGVRVRRGFREFGVGDLAGQPDLSTAAPDVIAAWRAGNLDAAIPGAESGSEIVARMKAALEDLVDQFRGRDRAGDQPRRCDEAGVSGARPQYARRAGLGFVDRQSRGLRALLRRGWLAHAPLARPGHRPTRRGLSLRRLREAATCPTWRP